MVFAWKQFLTTPVCIGCGSFFVERSLFCHDCYEALIVPRIVNGGDECSEFADRHHYLIEWSSLGSDKTAQLIYRLKSNNSIEAIAHYAELLAPRLLEVTAHSSFAAIVPIPSSKKSSVHAHLLAAKLSQKIGIPVMDVLQKISSAEQKTLTASERSLLLSIQLSSRAHEEFTRKASRQRKYIFVDDVLTTGESFKQASAALTDHKQNLIVTLFYRSRSARFGRS